MAGKYVFNVFTGKLDWTELPGGGGTNDPIVFVQASPSSHWHVVHGRGTNPSVVLERDDGQVIGGFGVQYPDDNTVDIFPGLMAGTATLNF